jgi:hypothetical protein
MQETGDESEGDSVLQEGDGVGGVSQDPDQVDIGGLAYLEVSNRVDGDPEGVFFEDRFSVKLYYYDRLYWRHKAAVQLAQGLSVQKVLGPEWIIIDGKTVPAWHPRPGLEIVVVAKVLDNPGLIEPGDMFIEIRNAME